MKTYLVAFSFILLFQFSFSQQQEHLTQYQYNQFEFNPAVAGSKNCIDVKGGYRYQWAGIDGAPQFGFINLNAPLRFGRKTRSMFGPTHGIGAQIKSDRLGIASTLDAHLSYAFHMSLSRYAKLSFGASFGMKQIAYNSNNIVTIEPDNALPIGQSKIVPDAQFGVWLRTKNEFFGVSIQNLFGNSIEEISPDYRLRRHWYLTAGKQFKMNSDWIFTPSALALITYHTPIDFHISALMDYKNTLTFGLGLRRTDAITAQVRVKLFGFLSIGYSFDYVISDLQGDMYHTHELTFGFNSCSGYGGGRTSTTTCETFE